MSGFTLIESVVVLCIITLILGLVFPAVYNTDTTLKDAKREIVIQIRETRADAIESGTKVEYTPEEIEDVDIKLSSELYFYPNGSCNCCIITLTHEDEQVVLRTRGLIGDIIHDE